MDDAEDGGVCADAECEREDGHGREAGTARQRPYGVDEIAPQIFEPDEGSRVALKLLRLIYAAERLSRHTSGLVAAQPALNELVFDEREMRGDLASQLALGAFEVEQV
jgi:hypothetical protein